MAEADKTVVVEINYNTKEAVKSLNDLTEVVEREKVAQAQLKDQMEKGEISQTKYSKKIELSKEVLRKANTERKATIKLLGTEKGSVNQLKAQISDITKKRDKLNLTTKKGREQAEKYNKQLKDMRKNLTDVNKSSKTNSGLMKQMKGGLGALGLAVGGVALATKAFNGIMGSTQTLADKFKRGMDKAEAATGFFFRTIATGDWKNFFQRFKEVSKAAGEYADAMDRLSDLNRSLSVDESKRKQRLAQLQLIYTDTSRQEKERLDAVNEFIQIQDELAKKRVTYAKEEYDNTVKNAAIQIGSSEETIKKLSEEYNSMEDQLELGKEYNQLKEQESVLIDAITDGAKGYQTELDEVRKRLKAMGEEGKKAGEIQMQYQSTNDELLSKVADSAKKYYEAEASYEESIKRAITSRGTVINQITAQERAAASAKLKETADEEKANNKFSESEKKRMKKDADFEKALEKELADFEKALDLEVANERMELEDQITENALENTEKRIELHQAEREERQAFLEETYSSFQQIIEAASGMANARVTIASDAFAKLATLNYEELNSASDTFLAIGNAAKGLTNLIIAGHEKELNNLEAKKNAELVAAGDNIEEREKIEARYENKKILLLKKQFKEERKKAIADATIAMSLAIVKGLAAGLPLPGIAMAALAGTLGGIQIASIKNQPEPQYTTMAEGGAVIGGKPHSQGGTKFFGEDGTAFEAEKNEALFVLKKDATAEIAALSMLNESFGGRSFSGGRSKHLQEGGEVDTGSMERQVDEAIQRTPIFVKVGDVETGLTDYNKVKQAGVI